MKPNASALRSGAGTVTRIPDAPVITSMPVRTSDIGSV